ncbi:MogA/MoaB family molybdenum cofactor biosynthesis protein [Nitrolancea hollandica]|uniref:Molybdenum cofactor biosynthesis protein B n=1 Tax=Nitrolancea hollandica Lb TaxID=1129897 RepID=I4EGJ9_9BACT|nr:molybdenum cofactor biosynthesis protein B [Nitrolancea hollandica]CCF83811.1 molybdopterin GTP-binding precursor Z biosynthesis component [Nitrolancea hollandica Lb]
MSVSAQEHKDQAPERIRCAVVTVSDTRTPETDKSGALIRERLESAGHVVIDYRIVRDEPAEIGPAVDELAGSSECDAIIFNGGTGIARRDTTFDVIDARLEKRIDGFGELFRYLSYAEIGSAAMMSRATAGVYQGTIVLLTPGSSNAVRLAMDKLILPELAHMVYEIRK